MPKSNIYYIWKGMRNRCNNPNNQNYKDYGGRGIKVCKQWDSFQNFQKDMSSTYKKGLTLDRINNNKGYYPKNCRWADRKMQGNNRRSNILLTHNGITKNATQRSKIVGIKADTIIKRFHRFNWTHEQILTTPLIKKYDKFIPTKFL